MLKLETPHKLLRHKKGFHYIFSMQFYTFHTLNAYQFFFCHISINLAQFNCFPNCWTATLVAISYMYPPRCSPTRGILNITHTQSGTTHTCFRLASVLTSPVLFGAWQQNSRCLCHEQSCVALSIRCEPRVEECSSPKPRTSSVSSACHT